MHATQEGDMYRVLTLFKTFSSSKASATATAAAQETGLPANVPPYEMGSAAH